MACSIGLGPGTIEYPWPMAYIVVGNCWIFPGKARMPTVGVFLQLFTIFIRDSVVYCLHFIEKLDRMLFDLHGYRDYLVAN